MAVTLRVVTAWDMALRFYECCTLHQLADEVDAAGGVDDLNQPEDAWTGAGTEMRAS